MSQDTKHNVVYTDQAGTMFQELRGIKVALYASPSYAGTELHLAYADDNLKLCYLNRGRWLRPGGSAAVAHPKPRQLHVDKDGQLYSFHAGTYSKVTLL